MALAIQRAIVAQSGTSGTQRTRRIRPGGCSGLVAARSRRAWPERDSMSQLSTVAGNGARPSVRIEDLRGVGSLARAREAWERLERKEATRSLPRRWEWIQTHLEHLVADPETLRTFVVSEPDGGPLAVLPLKPHLRRLGGLVSAHLWEIPEHPHVLLSDFVAASPEAGAAALRAVRRALLENGERCDGFRFSRLLPDSSALAVVANAHRLPRLVRPVDTCDVLPAAPEQEMLARISKNRRSALRRSLKRVQGKEGAVFRCARTQEELRPAFLAFLDVEASGWKGHSGRGSAIRLKPALLAYYETLLERFGRGDDARIYSLEVGQTPIAVDFCLRSGVTVYSLKIGHDEAWRAVSPGHLLTLRVADDLAVRQEASHLNLMTGSEHFEGWRPQRLTVSEAFVFGPHPRWWLAIHAARLTAALRKSRAAAPSGHRRGPDGARQDQDRDSSPAGAKAE